MRRSTIILVFVAAGCDEVPDELDDPGLPAISDEDSRLATPLDQDGMDSLFRRTRLAFRERDGVLRGGDATSGAEITSQGVAVTPYNWPRDAVLDRGRPTDTTGVVAGAPLRLETSRIARATATGSSRVGARTLRVAPDGAAELRGDEGTEVVRNVDGGIEQSWRFDAAPVGDGDLTVRVAVSGQMYGGRTSSGLHFYDPVTGLGFRYSDAVWIDADGNRTPLVAEFETGEIVLKVPGDVVRTSRYPAILDPTVGAELGYDNPVYGPATQGQYQPDIAFSGSLVNGELFVVWADYRRDTTFTSTVFGARVRASGDVVDVDEVGMLISNEPGDQRSPAVAWGDDRDGVADRYYLVVWEDPTRVASDQIRGRLVRDDGTFVNTAPFSLQLFDADNGSGASQPDVAFHHFHDPEFARFFVTWRRSLGGVRVRSYSLEPNGVIAQSGANATQGSTAATPAMACAYPLCLVVWSESSNIYGRSVGQFGDFGPAPPDPPRTISDHLAVQLNPDVAMSDPRSTPGDDESFMVVWEDYRNGTVDIFAQHVHDDGTLLGANFPVSTATGNQTTPAIAGHGWAAAGENPGWLATWVDTRNGVEDIYGQRLQRAGGVGQIEGSAIAISTAGSTQITPAACSDRVGPPGTQRYLVAWSDYRSSDFGPDIYGARVRNTGVVEEPSGFLISKSANHQEAPAIASCLGKSLTAWTDARNSYAYTDIYGAITSSAGVVLVNNILISSTSPGVPAAGRQDFPDVACDTGTGDFFVVWDSTGNIRGSRVRASDGLVLDSLGLNISTATNTQTQPAIAFNNGFYQVVWADLRSGSNYDIWSQRVTASSGALSGSAVNISGVVTGDQLDPDVTFDTDQFGATRFLVVWEDGRLVNETNFNWDIFGRYITTSGSLGSAFQIEANTATQVNPSVATRPAGFLAQLHLVVYEDNRNNPVNQDVYGKVVNPNGTVGSTLAIASGSDNTWLPQVAQRTGDQMTVTFYSDQGAADPAFDFGVRGQDLDISPLALVGAVYNISSVANVRERTPAISCASSTSCQVPYRRYDDAEGADRVKRRMLTY